MSSDRPGGAAEPPPFAACSACTYTTSFEFDLVAYRRAGIGGMGIWEYKLPDGDVGPAVEQFLASGLAATFCFPKVPGVIHAPGLFPEPRDPSARVELLKEGIRRLARFRPAAVACLPGAPEDHDPETARRLSIEGLREAAFTAGEEGVVLALEVIRARPDGSGFARTIPEALELISETGMDNIQLMLDTWHVADDPNVVRDIDEHADRIVAVQVDDRPPGSQGWWDRALPGDGELDLVPLLRALRDGGYRGWYELEVFSDDGTLGHDVGESSLWRWEPEELLTRGRQGFERLWREAQDG